MSVVWEAPTALEQGQCDMSMACVQQEGGDGVGVFEGLGGWLGTPGTGDPAERWIPECFVMGWGSLTGVGHYCHPRVFGNLRAARGWPEAVSSLWQGRGEACPVDPALPGRWRDISTYATREGA